MFRRYAFRFRQVAAVLLALVAGCDSGTTVPDGDPLPAASPGVQLPVSPTQDDGNFPTVGWDIGHNALVVPNHDREVPTTIVKIDLDLATATPLQVAAAGVQVLRIGGSNAALYSNSDLNTGEKAALTSVTTGKITGLTGVQFQVSDDGRWVVFADSGWKLMDLSTTTRTTLPPMGASPIAVSNDGGRIAFASLPEPRAIAVLDVGASTIDSIKSPDAVLDAVFDGAQLHLLTVRIDTSSEGTTYHFFDRSSAGDSVALGTASTKHVPDFRTQLCGAWSHGTGPRTAVAGVQMTWAMLARARFNFLRLGDSTAVIASADIFGPADCSLSPDGRWFTYSDATGYYSTGRLFLSKVR